MLDREVQYQNVYLLIVVIPSGMVMLSKLVQFEKSPSARIFVCLWIS